MGRAMRAVVDLEALAELDYAEARQGEQEWRLFVAARLGATRLIDNLGVPVPD